MTEQEIMAELLAFFKALADENRLRIVGLLAQRPYSVEKLAEELDLGVSTVSHHLGKLSKAGLVSVQVDGHYYRYSLRLDHLHAMAQRLLQAEQLPQLSPASKGDAFERKVLETFLDADGRIKRFPAQEKKYLVILAHVVKAFDAGVRYSEKQVNEKLAGFSDDTAMLRRYLVDYRFMEREGGGGAYWRLDDAAARENEPEQ